MHRSSSIKCDIADGHNVAIVSPHVVGKTTLAMSLVVGCVARGLDVVLILPPYTHIALQVEHLLCHNLRIQTTYKAHAIGCSGGEDDDDDGDNNHGTNTTAPSYASVLRMSTPRRGNLPVLQFLNAYIAGVLEMNPSMGRLFMHYSDDCITQIPIAHPDVVVVEAAHLVEDGTAIPDNTLSTVLVAKSMDAIAHIHGGVVGGDIKVHDITPPGYALPMPYTYKVVLPRPSFNRIFRGDTSIPCGPEDDAVFGFAQESNVLLLCARVHSHWPYVVRSFAATCMQRTNRMTCAVKIQHDGTQTQVKVPIPHGIRTLQHGARVLNLTFPGAAHKCDVVAGISSREVHECLALGMELQHNFRKCIIVLGEHAQSVLDNERQSLLECATQLLCRGPQCPTPEIMFVSGPSSAASSASAEDLSEEW